MQNQIDLDPTKAKLAEMLTENTGTHFLDSGGQSGRNWQRNQTRNFEAEPETSVRFTTWTRGGSPALCVEITHNVYHWLAERLDVNDGIQSAFEAWQEANDEDGQMNGMAGYMEHLAETADDDCRRAPAGIYGEGEPITVNTYNGEDLLSQTLQYIYWTDDDGDHVLLQIHGGADVREGYTDAQAFDLDSNHELGLFDNARAHLYVDSDTVLPANTDAMLPGMEDQEPDKEALAEHMGWGTDDGCNFTGEGRTYGEGHDDVQDLESYDIEEFKEDEHGTQRNDEGQTLDDRRGRGTLCIDDDGNAWCPLSGGQIMGAAY